MTGLGRLPSFDPRSREYPIRTLLDRDGETLPRSYTWSCQPHLNQGDVGACVGFGWSHELAARPKEVVGVTNSSALDLYYAAQKVDEFPGEAYEGTSVLAGAKVVKSEGFMPEYRWAFGLNDVILTLGYKGPVVLGINWYDGMFTPDVGGVIHPTGSIAGGHCILANGVSVKHRIVRLHNSWGLDWGIFGDCFMTWDGLDRLLHEGGEACVPVLRVKTP